MTHRAQVLVLLTFVAGCAAPAPAPPAGEGAASSSLGPGPAFSTPLVLTTDGPGFEPSIDVGADGVIYAAAAKTARPNDGTRLSSWLWYSADGGRTWDDLPSPHEIHQAMAGFEGDTAVDAEGRFYFVDTYLADNAISRWSPGPNGPEWDFSRPIQGTTALLDDRPWLTAHGDGIVYLVSNNAAPVPATGDLLGGSADGAGMWVFTSQDAGMTWSLGHGFPGQRWCFPAASQADDRTVIVACYQGEGPGATLDVHVSTDRGVSWRQGFEAAYENGTGYLTPAAAIDRAGSAYVAWIDDSVEWSGLQDVTWTGDRAGRILLARSQDAVGWETLDVTPFAGRFGVIHAAAGDAGVVGVAFYGTTDLSPDDDSEWFAYALVATAAGSARPAWTLSKLAGEPMAIGAMPPRDFFQGAIGPDNAMHAVLQQDRRPPQDQGGPADGIPADVLYVRQIDSPGAV